VDRVGPASGLDLDGLAMSLKAEFGADVALDQGDDGMLHQYLGLPLELLYEVHKFLFHAAELP